ncbi:hypothetical protein [Mariniblastus fucicola]|uniref:Uncharacterized protein n=1 Tax=Mariniblastus fucicola TaxID=980251 RepID=A0A5B9PAR9_9BACT|nr:hypothetical protein [Mariniblastus fucicola]QEG22579.1 hypothetical protein MFFC18_24620 [Mariniblastus fucicola]
MKSVILSVLIVAATSSVLLAQSIPDDDAVESALETVNRVGLHGVGHADAVESMKILNSISASQIPVLLKGMDGSNQISANWIRGAIQKAASRYANDLPADSITTYFEDQSNDPQGRWLAWNLLCRTQPEFRVRTTDMLATDPSMPLREIGVAKLIADAESIGDNAEDLDDAAKDEKLALLRKALENARDVTQIQTIAKQMAPLGQEVNLRKQLGFLETWHVVAGFDNKDEAGFDVVYGPESKLGEFDFAKTYVVGDETAVWMETTTSHKLGVVDLNSVVGKTKGVIAYAASNLEMSEGCEAEVRIGTPNAHKIWVNGTLVMSNEIYHNSNSIDKFSAPVKLKTGSNRVLVKLCQNEQTDSWAQDWSFQVRFCDSTGKPVR